MDTKFLVILAIVLVACVSVLGYMFYAGVFSPPSGLPSPATSEASPSSTPIASTELRIFIAASLTSIVENASQAFKEANNCNLIINSAGSNSLFQQINSGSPCDVFMSADYKWTKQLNDSGLLYNNAYQNFTTNTIVLMMPKDNPKNITSLLDLTKPGIRLIIAAPSVPAGSYANSTLAKIDKTWGNSSSVHYKGPEWQNYYSNVIANVVSYEATVEDVVTKVALNLGAVDAGIAFVSDATVQGENLVYVEIPSEVNTHGTYGIAVIGNTAQADLAAKYMNYWLSRDGQNLLNEFGFGT